MKRSWYSSVAKHGCRRALRLEEMESRSLMAADIAGVDLWELSDNSVRYHRLEQSSDVAAFHTSQATAGANDLTSLRFSLHTTPTVDRIGGQPLPEVRSTEPLGPLPMVIVVHGPRRPDSLIADSAQTVPNLATGVGLTESFAIIIPRTNSAAAQVNLDAAVPRFTLVVFPKAPQSILLPISSGTNLLVDSVSRYDTNPTASVISLRDAQSHEMPRFTANVLPQNADTPSSFDNATGVQQHRATRDASILDVEPHSQRAITTETGQQQEPVTGESSWFNATLVTPNQGNDTQISLGTADVLAGMLPLTFESRQEVVDQSRTKLDVTWSYGQNDFSEPIKHRREISSPGSVARLIGALPLPEGMVELTLNQANQRPQSVRSENWLSADASPITALQIFLRADAQGGVETESSQGEPSDQSLDSVAGDPAEQSTHPLTNFVTTIVVALWTMIFSKPIRETKFNYKPAKRCAVKN